MPSDSAVVPVSMGARGRERPGSTSPQDLDNAAGTVDCDRQRSTTARVALGATASLTANVRKAAEIDPRPASRCRAAGGKLGAGSSRQLPEWGPQPTDLPGCNRLTCGV